MKKLAVPKFANEAQEAQWWHDHRDAIEANLAEALLNGTTGYGTARRALREARESKNITIRMPLADLDRARKLSKKKGLGYQTYMKMLLHEALDREESAAKKPARRKSA